MQNKTRRTFYQWLDDRTATKDNVVKFLFDHVRNLGLSGLVVGAGLYWLRNPTNDPEWLRSASILFMVLGGMLLFLINFAHGLKKLGDAGVPSKGLILIGLVLYVPMIALFTQLLARR